MIQLFVVLFAIIALVEIYRAWRFERDRKATLRSINELLAHYDERDELIRESTHDQKQEIKAVGMFIGKRLQTIAHDCQQIKTGNEWSKKREHALDKKIDRVIKLLSKKT